MSTSFEVGGQDYDASSSQELRQELIKLRDAALSEPTRMRESVVLSHAIGWMANAIKQLWPDAPEA